MNYKYFKPIKIKISGELVGEMGMVLLKKGSELKSPSLNSVIIEAY